LPILSTLPANLTEPYNNIIGGFGLDDLQSYARDIRDSWKVYLICLVTTFILIFLWNWMLRWCAEFLAWIAIVVVGVGIVALGFGIKYYST
jgi:MFS superfamily sulfate permease-like transporter